MRTTARISLCALALLAAGIAGCRDDDRLSYEKDAQEGDVPPIGVQSISVLKSLYHDRTTRITREISIQGHIVANDTAGEFYKEIVVEDDTGGIVLSIDDERLYRTCRLFDFVTINCQGLALGSEGGTLLLGTFPTGDYCVDRIPAADMARYLAVTPAATRRQPLTLGFEEVAPRHISRYVRFDRVRLAEEATTWCDFDPETGDPVTTDRTLLDTAGRQFVVRTDRRCDYARKPLPKERSAASSSISTAATAFASPTTKSSSTDNKSGCNRQDRTPPFSPAAPISAPAPPPRLPSPLRSSSGGHGSCGRSAAPWPPDGRPA